MNMNTGMATLGTNNMPNRQTAPLASAPRLFAAPEPQMGSHLRTFGPMPEIAANELLREVDASGLLGRGGAGFPTARKIMALRAASTASTSSRPVVIANGGEGEPLSQKDAALQRHAPHLVIDGLLLLARLVDASELIINTAPAQRPYLAAALAERSDAAQLRLVNADASFISGEASAVVGALEGRKPVPRDNIVRLATSGYRGRPTLVQNVETLANLGLVARFGAQWFRSVGTHSDPGTRLLTVSSSTQRSAPTVIEVPSGITVADAMTAGGIDPTNTAAALIGGYHGTWILSDAFGAPLSTDGLHVLGASPGAGIVVALDRQSCPINYSATIVKYLARQSARQCGPCVNGLPAIAKTIARLAEGERTPALVAELERLAAVVSGRGSCHHPDGTVRFVLSTLSAFQTEVHAHLDGRCLEVTS